MSSSYDSSEYCEACCNGRRCLLHPGKQRQLKAILSSDFDIIIAAAEARGYARGIERAAQHAERWGMYMMAEDIRALSPASASGHTTKAKGDDQ